MMKRQIYSCWREAMVSLLFCLAPIILTFSQDYAHCTLEGRWAEGECFAVRAHEQIGYYATGGLLEIVDYTQPGSPQKLSDFACNGRIEGIAIHDDLAFLVGGYHGYLNILDISDLENPVLVGSLVLPGPHDIVLEEGYAYISCRDDGFYIIDISDPAHPVISGTANPNGSVQSAVISGDFAFVATLTHGLAFINVSDKENPVVTYESESEGSCRGIDFENGILYLAALDRGLLIYQIYPIFNFLGSYDPGGHAEDVFVDDGIAYVANRYPGIYMLDVHDPINPVLLGEYETQRANEIFVENHMVFLADTWSCRVMDASDPEEIMMIDEVEMANDLKCLAFRDKYLYTGNIYKGIHVFDMSSPVHFDQIATFDHGGEFQCIVFEGHYAYVAGGSPGLLILDISFPDIPWLAGQYDFEESMFSVAIKNKVAFCGLYNGGLYAIDVQDPANPIELGHFPLEKPIADVRIDGDYAYLSCEDDGFYILDISNLNEPVEVAHLPTDGEVLKVQVKGQYAYLAEGGKGFSVVDIATKESPQRIAQFDHDAYINGAFVDGHYAYLSGYSRGLRILDIGQLDAIEEVAYYQTGENAEMVEVHNGYIYVGDNYDGIYVLEFDSLSVGVHEISLAGLKPDQLIRSVYPNPSSGPFCIELSPVVKGTWEARIIDQDGMIRYRQSGSDAHLEISLASLDKDQLSLPVGVYYLELRANGKREVRKIVRF